MNKRAILKKARKHLKGHPNHYFYWYRVIFDKGAIDYNYDKMDRLIGMGNLYWQYKDPFSDCCIIQIKPRHLEYDTKCLIKTLKESGLKFKIR